MKGWFPGIFFSAFSLIFIGVGSYLAWSQDQALRIFKPVTATVLSRQIVSESDSDGTTHRPAVKYQYVVGSQTYENDQVTVLKESSGRRWAERLLARVPSGETVKAFYDPVQPKHSFLLRRVSFLPYISVLFPMVFMCIGLRSMASEKPTDVKGLRTLIVIAIAWNSVGLLVATHYFYAGGVLDLTPKVGLSFYGLIGFLMLYSIGYLWLDSKKQRPV